MNKEKVKSRLQMNNSKGKLKKKQDKLLAILSEDNLFFAWLFTFHLWMTP